MAAKILYLSFDGVLQPLGYSQVVRVVSGLGQRGLPYELVSLERSTDLAQSDQLKQVEAVLGVAGVAWTRVPTDMRELSSRRTASALARTTRAAIRLARTHDVGLVHARSYPGAAVAAAVRGFLGVPYLFDARGCWIDERSGPGDWFSNPLPYAAGKFAEQRLFRDASAVVTLTELQASDVAAGPFAGRPEACIEVIPTCTDYAAFPLRDSRPTKPESSSTIPEVLQRKLRGKTVVGIVGALNRSYLPEQSVTVAKLAAEASPDVELLVLSRQTEQYSSLLRSLQFPLERVSFAECRHEQMPDWLQWIDWGMLLLGDTAAKRGSMPTKLAEFFATGVQPVAYGCNSEMTAWVRRSGSGVVLETIDPPDLRHAADAIAAGGQTFRGLQRARELTEAHFGLKRGLDRYEHLIHRVLGGEDRSSGSPVA